MKLTPLRYLLLWDSALLVLLGAVLVMIPREVQRFFHFENLPPAVSYILGLWGCVLVTLAIGYFVAAKDPIRHVIWVQVGIARGALEFFVGVIYVARGVASLRQAGLGIALAGLITVGYIVFYPRNRQVVTPAV